MSKADIAARGLADEYELNQFPVDVERVAEGLGIIVVRQEGPEDLSGMLLRRDGQVAIGLNPAHPATRQRFALAHLIGHHQLHPRRDLILDTDQRITYEADRIGLACLPLDREEADANRFAAMLLAPPSAVRNAVHATPYGTAEELLRALAGQFGLSHATMGYWLIALGMIVHP
ncbi:ImmA/IrrE family metallo-endopeptidase [Streptomyces sp. NPDC005877]|uniref:ImmA/IrrE family metallo-endopeptidase n=1 Tax=Streptomyces sp. NPDC005877 TaxID=3155346 RepID=UPI0033C01BF2